MDEGGEVMPEISLIVSFVIGALVASIPNMIELFLLISLSSKITKLTTYMKEVIRMMDEFKSEGERGKWLK